MYSPYPPTNPAPPAPVRGPGKPVIRVDNDRAIVSWGIKKDKTKDWQPDDIYAPADNWKELQPEAVKETIKQGCDGAPGTYECPPDLARRAVWASDTRDHLRLAGYLIYAVNEQASVGTVIQVMETNWTYEYFIFHSEESALAMAEKNGRILLHIRDVAAKGAS